MVRRASSTWSRSLIRGRKVEEALNILKFSPKAMADDVRKVLASAVANAENNHNLDVDALVVAEASVGKSISMKRFATRARGRSTPDRQAVQPHSRRRSRAGRSVMGQKTSPVGLRLQINRTWDSRWFAEGQDYGRLLLEDLKIRKYILKTLPQAAISKVVIERPAKICRVSIYAARPGVIIGKKGADIEKLQEAARQDDRLGSQPEHRRDPQAGNRRASSSPRASPTSSSAASPSAAP